MRCNKGGLFDHFVRPCRCFQVSSLPMTLGDNQALHSCCQHILPSRFLVRVPQMWVFNLSLTRSIFEWSLGCWRGFGAAIFDPYRPEQHYMRGPGPRWHKKFATG